MKTIFVFNDSRPSEPMEAILAVDEDGHLVNFVKFDGATVACAAFALGAEHELASRDPDIAVPVNVTRENALRRYDATYGAGNWIAVWLDAPRTNNAWRRAIELLRARLAPPVPAFSDEALAGIFGVVFGSADAVPHTTH
jgi:hypothetical protein